MKDEVVGEWVDKLNLLFLRCVNEQTHCLLSATIDPNQHFINVLALLLILPILKALWVNNFTVLPLEYGMILLLSLLFLYIKFKKNDEMRVKYDEAQLKLSEQFSKIQECFNQKYGFLEMSYKHSIDENEQDYIEIKVTKQPTIKEIQENKQKIYKLELIPIIE